jgi:heptosyltransferase II
VAPAIQRLLVRAPNWVGDVVLSLPAVRDLRRNFAETRIEVLARPWVAEIYRAVPEVDDVRQVAGFREDVAWLRGRFDAAALLTNSFGTALQVYLSGTKERWGYATDGRGPLLTRAARVPGEIRGHSEVYYYRAMLAGVGLSVSAACDSSLACRPDWHDEGDRLLERREGGWIGLVPGAAFGGAKRWLPERYALVADQLSREKGASVAVLGAAAERGVAERIASLMESTPRVLCGETTLGGLVGVLARLRLLITNDSGPMHLAAALGVPVVAVFGPTDWRETAPRGPLCRLVREPVSCAPCKQRECPIDHRCMRRITADRVLAESLGLLEEAEGA